MLSTNKETNIKTVGKDIKYQILTSTVDHPDNFRYTTYGISVLDGNGYELCKYSDISTDKGWVEQFALMCVEKDVSWLHVGDVLKDSMD